MKIDYELIAVLLVVFVVIGGFLVWDSISDDDSESPKPVKDKVEYDYQYYSDTVIRSNYGMTYTPDPGYQYIVVEINVHNVNFEEFKTDYIAWDWEIIYNGTVHSTSSDMFMHPDYQAPSLLPGGSADLIRVFEVPNDVVIEDLKFRNSYFTLYGDPNIVFTPTLIP